MINQRGKDYIFDLERFLSFEGKTGTYLLYTVTRINSILQKAGGGACQLFGIYNDADRELWLNLLLTGAVFERAFEEKAPNNLCENAYQLAALFSRFYHDNHILAEEDEKKRESWLALCRMVKKVLEKHLDVLGIETVERM